MRDTTATRRTLEQREYLLLITHADSLLGADNNPLNFSRLACSAGGAAQRAQCGVRQQAGGRVEQRRDAVRDVVLLLPLRPA